MRTCALAWICLLFFAFNPPPDTKPTSPLAGFSPIWNDPVYHACNTAAKTPWLTPAEREIIYILNLVRRYPKQFNNTVVKPWAEKKGKLWLKENKYYTSLIDTLARMPARSVLKPDSTMWVSARCHAETSGIKGYVGHVRQDEKCKELTRYYGECCHYGYSNPLDIVMSLLIDDGVESLGHRYICLGHAKGVGVSMMPHEGYGTNTVLDFN